MRSTVVEETAQRELSTPKMEAKTAGGWRDI